MTGSGDQHQPTLTDKQRSVLLTARRKQLCERYALRLVSALAEAPRVPAQWFLDQLGFLTRSHYNDVTEERSLVGLCGYALCGGRLFSDDVSSDTGWLSRQRWMRRQYAISTHTNRVYDIGERKRFCSNRCFRASRHIQLQVHTSPLWLRERDAMVRFHLLPDDENLSGVAGDIIPFTVQLPRVSDDDDGVVEGSSNAGSDDNREKRDITSAEEMVSYIVDNYDELEARFNELSLDPTSERVDDTSDKEIANRRVSHCLNIDQKSDCTDNSSVVSSTITPTTSVCVAPADPNIADSENGDESAKEHTNVTSCGTITSDLSSSCSNRLSTNGRSLASKRAVNGTSRAHSRSHQKEEVFGSGRRCSGKAGNNRPVGDTSLAQIIARLEDWFSIGADTSETAHTANSEPNDTASSVEKSDLTVICCQDRGTRCDENTSQAASGGSQSDAGPNNTISADSVSQAIGGICCSQVSSRIDDVNHPDSTTDKSLPNVNRQEMELNNQMLLQFLQGKRVRFETNVEIKQTCPNSSVEPCQDKGVPQPNSEHVQSANNTGGDLLKTDVEESDRSRVTSRDSFTEEVEPVQLVPTVDSLDVARVRRRLFCRQIERCLSSLLPLVVGSPSLAAQLAASMRRFTAHMHLTATNVTLPSRLHTVTSVCLLRLLLRMVNSNRGNPDGVVLTEEQYARADRVVCRHLQSYGLDVPVLDRTIDNIASSKRFHNI